MERGVGVTCISLAISNFVCSKLGRKTAYIELNATNQIFSLSHGGNQKSFSYYGIDFFPQVSVTSLREILNKNYDFYILDMGVLNHYTATEFAKCDKQLFVCSFSKWKKKQTMEKLNELYQQMYICQESVILLANLEGKKSTLLPMFPNRISIPFISNPFQLEPSLFHVLYLLLGGKI